MTPRICHVFPTFGPGGSQSRTRKLLDALGPRYEHTVIALDGDLRSAQSVGSEVPLRAIAAPAAARGRLPHAALARLLRELAPDLVATYNWGSMDALVTARMLGLPVIHHEDGFNPDEVDGQKLRRVWARRLLLRGVDGVIVPSRTLHEIGRTVWRIPEPVLTYVPNGVDTDRFRPGPGDAIRTRLGLAPRDLLVGTVGHLNPAKDIGRLVRAVGSANNELPVDLVVIGEGPEHERLMELAGSLQIAGRVHLVGHVADPAPWYRALDVFAMSSRTEQMPVSVLEAMATGLPVVATAVGDTWAMVSPDNRELVVPLADKKEYVDALLRVLIGGPLRYALGAANRAHVRRHYDQTHMIERHAAIWKRALGAEIRRRAPAPPTAA